MTTKENQELESLALQHYDKYVWKHTSAPWQMHDPEYCPQEIYGNINLSCGKVTGTLVCTVQDGAEMEANSRLIVEAPTMRMVLEAFTTCSIANGRAWDEESLNKVYKVANSVLRRIQGNRI